MSNLIPFDAGQEDRAFLQAEVDAALEEVIEGQFSMPSDDQLSEAMARLRWLPHQEVDAVIERSTYDGPIIALELIQRLIKQEAERMTEALNTMLVSQEKDTLLDGYRELAAGREALNAFFRRDYPRPPFRVLDRTFPVYKRRRRWRKTSKDLDWNQLASVAEAFQSDMVKVRSYLIESRPLRRLNKWNLLGRLWQALVTAPRWRTKRKKYEQSVISLLAATGELEGYLKGHFERYLSHLKQCRQFIEPSQYE